MVEVLGVGWAFVGRCLIRLGSCCSIRLLGSCCFVCWMGRLVVLVGEILGKCWQPPTCRRRRRTTHTTMGYYMTSYVSYMSYC